MDVTQDSLFQIDFAIRCRADCLNTSLTPITNLLIRPIIYNRLINPQKSEDYLLTYLDKRRFYGLTTLDSPFDTVLDYEISKYGITTDESLMPWETSYS